MFVLYVQRLYHFFLGLVALHLLTALARWPFSKNRSVCRYLRTARSRWSLTF
jgi:hypothetical protein